MKKKMLGMLLVITMLLTACTSNPTEETTEDVFAYYQIANELIEGLRTVEMRNELNIDIRIGEDEFSMPMINLVSANTISETEIEYAAAMIMPLDGGNSDADLVTETYYKDGYMYMNMYGDKIKAAVPVEDIANEVLVSAALAFEREAIKSQSMVDSGDGKEITMTLDSDMMAETLAGITESLRGQIDMFGLMEFTYSDINLSLVTDGDGRMKTFSFEFDMSFVMDGEDGRATFRTVNEILATENVTVDFPLDLDTYIDIASLSSEIPWDEDDGYEHDEDFFEQAPEIELE